MRKKLSSLSKILSFIALRPRSESEIRQRLIEYGATDLDSIISELKANQLINDQFFAEWFVDSRVRSNQRSNYQLRRELQAKGISEDIISNLLSPDLQSQSLLNLIHKKSRTLSRDKLLKYLLGRGFSYSQIQAKLDEIGISE